MTGHIEHLSAVFGAAFESAGLDPALGQARLSDRPDLADFQCNGALAAAKPARRNPRELAAEIAGAINIAAAGIEGLEIAGPGFLNVRLTGAAIADRAEAIKADPRAGAGAVGTPRKVVIDYAGPNVAKPMHVGHLRATIIGDALKRIFRFRGDQVWGDAHFGDWGFQMGLLIVAVSDEQPGLPYFEAGAEGPFPGEPPVSLADLERLYPVYSARIKQGSEDKPNPDFDPDLLARARRATAELQAGRPGYRALWRHFVDVSRTALTREFAALGVTFDLWNGESDADPYIAGMVEDLKAKGLLEPDQGAQIVRVSRDGDRKTLPPLLVLSSEGSAMYGTTDLATLVQRKADFDPDLVLYCVDQRQSDHFEQVFRASDLAGILPEDRLEHVGFGTMNGKDGKPFKTRAGGVMKLHDLIAMVREKAEERLADAGLGQDGDDAERRDIAMKVGVAALKFADLSNVRTTNYVFDLDQFMAFEGKTGPYLLYAAVRLKSLMRKAADAGVTEGPIAAEDAPQARALALTLDRFDAALAAAYDKRMPHFVCEHLYALAQGIMAFYNACPVMAEPDATLRASRLSLARAAHDQLVLGLSLIGVEAPERM